MRSLQKSACADQVKIELGPVLAGYRADRSGRIYSVLHIVAYSPIFKESVTQIKCATYCVLQKKPVK